MAVDRAVKGAEIVIHCGASMKGGWPEHKGGTVTGTQNVIDACKKHEVRQLVHISSMSVVDWAGSADTVVSEGAALEPRPDERGAYTRAKLEAEKLVREAAAGGFPTVILRPGQIFGGGIPLINGAVATVIGAICIRLREIYFSFLTLAFQMLLYSLIIAWTTIRSRRPSTRSAMRTRSSFSASSGSAVR